MDPLTIVLISFGGLIVLFLIWGYSLPARWEVSESVLLDVGQETVYDYLFSIRNWEQWTIWNKEENPKFEFSYEGPKAGCGATQCWKAGHKMGKTKICGGTRPDKIEYLFSFGQGHHMMKGKLELFREGNKTKVVWSAKGDAGKNPSKRIMAKMFKPYVQKDFQRGLARLKKVLESGLHELTPN